MHNQVNIRRMTEGDTEAVYELGRQTPEFAVVPGPPGFWSRERLRRWLNTPDDVLLVAEADGEIAGFVLSQLHRPTGKATLENIAVRPGYRRHGVATALLTACLDKLQADGATYVCALTRTNNVSGIAFFQRHSFQRGHDFAWMAKES